MKVFISTPNASYSGGSCIVAARTPAEALATAIKAREKGHTNWSPDYADSFVLMPRLDCSRRHPAILSDTIYIE